MANNNDTGADAWEFERGTYPWGEWWKGTKSQLQAAGIGIGVAFPGESGAPKRLVHTIDSRGCAVDIDGKQSGLSIGVYWATCPYVYRKGSWRHGPDEKRQLFAPGVQFTKCWYGVDEYVGNGSALVACGLIRDDQLPGQPGRGTSRCTYGPDGTPRTKGQSSPSTEGTKTITRQGATRFILEIKVGEEEEKRRRYEEKVRDIQRDAENIEGASERSALNITIDLLRRTGGPRVQSALCVRRKMPASKAMAHGNR